jgi:hypothetical protein
MCALECVDLKKAVKSAIVLYALIFTFASALMFYVPSAAYDYAALVAVALLTFIVAKHYFRMYKPANLICSGLALGVVFAVVMFVLDVLLMVYGFANQLGWEYFASTNQLLGYVLTIVVPVLAAKMVWGRKAGKARRRRR